MASFDELKDAYEELIDVMNLTEKVNGKKVRVTIPTDADEDYLKEKIVEAKGWIEEGDTFSPETQEVLDNIEKEDEPEAEPEPEPAKPARGKKVEKQATEDKPKGKRPEKAGEPGKPGIIATIVSLIENSGKKGITKEEILAELKEQFPDRNEQSMKNTINVQVPARIQKEKFALKKLEGGRWTKA